MLSWSCAAVVRCGQLGSGYGPVVHALGACGNNELSEDQCAGHGATNREKGRIRGLVEWYC